MVCVLQYIEHRLVDHELQRIAVGHDRLVQIFGRVVQIIDGFTIRVVVQAIAQLVQAGELRVIEFQRLRGRNRGRHQIVAERRHHGPCALAARQIPVHDQAGANIGRGINVRAEPGVRGNHTRRVMIKVTALHAAPQQSGQCGHVGFH